MSSQSKFKCRSTVAFIILLVVCPAPASSQTQRGGRLATPPSLKCPRDNTTSFTGRVLAYRRTPGRVFIRVRTDEQTTEEFTLTHPKRSDAGALFHINGEPFKSSDWKRVEARAGRLRPNMRATVWACYEGDDLKAERIDWRPAG
jgi:hypothetical protein